jgi:hypothetical protein
MKWVIAAVVAATIARIVWINALPEQTYFAKYEYFADQAVAGHLDAERLPDLSPGYLWFIAALRAIGASIKVIRALQIALLSLAALALAAVARRLRGDLAAVATLVLVFANQAALVNASDLEPEAMILLLNSVALWLLLRGSPLAGGVAIGLSIVFRPVGVLIALVLLAWHHRDARRILAGAAIPLALILGVNVARTGRVVIMDPGTVFYEGMNPLATGHSGVQPRIVKDLEPTIPGPDTLHVAYRMVAARAGHARSNAYWTRKALAFVRHEPMAAAGLIGRKLRFAIAGYDAYDVPSMELNRRMLGAVPLWISFALLVPLAVAGMGRERMMLIAYTIAAALPLVVFFVTARHRNPLLVPLAILGGCAIAAMFERRRIAVAGCVIVAAGVLSLRHPVENEDQALWTASFATNTLMRAGQVALATTWLPESVPPTPPALVRAAALHELPAAEDPSRRFSIAIALEQSGDDANAERLLRELLAEGFRPYRRSRGTSSVSYYLARALLHQNRRAEAIPLVAQARREAPGDADVLALSAMLGEPSVGAPASGARPGAGAPTLELDALHDPFTRDLALARASVDVGLDARPLVQRLIAIWPQWYRPRRL